MFKKLNASHSGYVAHKPKVLSREKSLLRVLEGWIVFRRHLRRKNQCKRI